MALSKQSIPSDYMEFLRCALCAHDFGYENPLHYPVTLPKSGLTICRKCIGKIHDDVKCPHDHPSVANYTSIDQLPTNYPLLVVLYGRSQLPKDFRIRYNHCDTYNTLNDLSKQIYKSIENSLNGIGEEIKKMLNNDKHRHTLGHVITKSFELLHIQYVNQQCQHKCLPIIVNIVQNITYQISTDNGEESANSVRTDQNFRSCIQALERISGQYNFMDERINDLIKNLNEIDTNQSNYNKTSNSAIIEKQLYLIGEFIKSYLKIYSK